MTRLFTRNGVSQSSSGLADRLGRALAGHADRRHKARYERGTRKVHLRSVRKLSLAVDDVDGLAEVVREGGPRR